MPGESRPNSLQDDLSRAEALLSSGERVELEVTGLNRGGLLVRFGAVGGFIPNSQLPAPDGQDLAASKKAWVGSRLSLRVIEVDPRRPSVIFAADSARAPEPPPEHLPFSAGEIVSGVVQEIFEDGVLIQLEGASGLIARSDLAWRWLDHPGDLVNRGDRLEARVLGAGGERADLRLSRKDLIANPWQIFGRMHKAGDLVLGTILQIRRTGLLVRLVPGVRGLVHRKDIDTPQVRQLDQIVSPGDKVTVRIAEFNPQKEHIRLKMWWAPK